MTQDYLKTALLNTILDGLSLSLRYRRTLSIKSDALRDVISHCGKLPDGLENGKEMGTTSSALWSRSHTNAPIRIRSEETRRTMRQVTKEAQRRQVSHDSIVMYWIDLSGIIHEGTKPNSTMSNAEKPCFNLKSNPRSHHQQFPIEDDNKVLV